MVLTMPDSAREHVCPFTVSALRKVHQTDAGTPDDLPVERRLRLLVAMTKQLTPALDVDGKSDRKEEYEKDYSKDECLDTLE